MPNGVSNFVQFCPIPRVSNYVRFCPARDAAGVLGWPRQAREPEAHSDSHRKKHAGKIDPSRGRAAARDIRAGGRDDPHVPRRSVDSGDWLPGAAAGGIFHDIVSCSTAGPDHNEGRDKTPPGRKESDTHVDERLWNTLSAPVRKGSTGQPAPIMEG